MTATGIEGHLDVGMPVLVNLDQGSRSQGNRIKSHVRGWSKDTYVLLDWPADSKLSILIRPNRECVVQFVHEGIACGFRSIIVDAGSPKHPQFRVSWPAEIETLPLRKHERVTVETPCTAILTNGEVVRAELRDISAGGCGVYLPSYSPECTDALLSFTLGKGIVFENLKAVARNVSKEKGGFLVGYQFQKPEGRTQHDLDFFIATSVERLRKTPTDAPRILLLEEDIDTSEQARRALEDAGFHVALAACVMDLFCGLRLGKPDAVILSLGASEIPVTDLCRIVGASPQCEATRIIAYGTNGDPGMADKVSQAGAAACVTDPRQLADAVRKALDVAPKPDEGAGDETPTPDQGGSEKKPEPDAPERD